MAFLRKKPGGDRRRADVWAPEDLFFPYFTPPSRSLFEEAPVCIFDPALGGRKRFFLPSYFINFT